MKTILTAISTDGETLSLNHFNQTDWTMRFLIIRHHCCCNVRRLFHWSAPVTIMTIRQSLKNRWNKNLQISNRHFKFPINSNRKLQKSGTEKITIVQNPNFAIKIVQIWGLQTQALPFSTTNFQTRSFSDNSPTAQNYGGSTHPPPSHILLQTTARHQIHSIFNSRVQRLSNFHT